MGRLALHNPAYVMPSLRKTLIQLLTEMEYSTVTSVTIFDHLLFCIDVYPLVDEVERNAPDYSPH